MIGTSSMYQQKSILVRLVNVKPVLKRVSYRSDILGDYEIEHLAVSSHGIRPNLI